MILTKSKSELLNSFKLIKVRQSYKYLSCLIKVGWVGGFCGLIWRNPVNVLPEWLSLQGCLFKYFLGESNYSTFIQDGKKRVIELWQKIERRRRHLIKKMFGFFGKINRQRRRVVPTRTRAETSTTVFLMSIWKYSFYVQYLISYNHFHNDQLISPQPILWVVQHWRQTWWFPNSQTSAPFVCWHRYWPMVIDHAWQSRWKR